MSLTLDKTLAGMPRTERGTPVVLHAHPKGTNYLYANGNSIFIRDFEDPSVCDVYTEHAKETTVAAYSPSGFYIASGDKGGKVRIWDTTNIDHILKAEYPIIGGAIKDIAWTEDSKRIMAVGEGGSSQGRFFLFDSGSSVGTVAGGISTINCCDLKQNRPYRAICGSEDRSFSFYEGPPFKLKKKNQETYSKFVNCSRFAPDGSKFAIGGAGGKCIICDGKTGEILHELSGGNIHSGGIYGLSWSPDSKELLTVSADRTAKIWDVEENKLATEFKFGRAVGDQQVGCLWSGKNTISLSLDGNITYLDRNNPEAPARILHGHSKAVTCIGASVDGSKVLSASFTGRALQWDISTGLASPLIGQGHSTQVTKISVCDGVAMTCGVDDTVRGIDIEKGEYLKQIASTPSQPHGVSAGKDGLCVVACINEVVVLRNFQQVHLLTVKYQPRCVSIHPNQCEVAVGSADKNVVYIYELDGDILKEKAKVETKGNPRDVKYSPCGMFLGTADDGRGVHVFDTSDYSAKSLGRAAPHNARVNAVAWSPDSTHLASCSIDKSLALMTVPKLDLVASRLLAHGSSVNDVAWLDNQRLVTCGHGDCSLRTWTVGTN